MTNEQKMKLWLNMIWGKSVIIPDFIKEGSVYMDTDTEFNKNRLKDIEERIVYLQEELDNNAVEMRLIKTIASVNYGLYKKAKKTLTKDLEEKSLQLEKDRIKMKKEIQSLKNEKYCLKDTLNVTQYKQVKVDGGIKLQEQIDYISNWNNQPVFNTNVPFFDIFDKPVYIRRDLKPLHLQKTPNLLLIKFKELNIGSTQEQTIKTLEQLLDVKLNSWQQDFLFKGSYIDNGRTSGKTFIFLLAYTLGLMSLEDLMRLEGIDYKINAYQHGHYFRQLNDDFYNKLNGTVFEVVRCNNFSVEMEKILR